MKTAKGGIVGAIVIVLMVALSGCGDAMVARGYGDYERAQAGVGVQAGAVEVGVQGTYTADGPDDAIGVIGYAAVAIDPNTMAGFGLGGDWQFPLGADVRVGAHIRTEFDDGDVGMGPLVIVDLQPDAALSPSVWYEFANYGGRARADAHLVMAGAVHRF